MAQVDADSKVVVIGKGDSMKWLNEYFFGGQAHWSDYLWFYGTIAFGLLTVVFLYFHIN